MDTETCRINRAKIRAFRRLLEFLEKEKKAGRKIVNVKDAMEFLTSPAPRPISQRERIYNVIIGLQEGEITMKQIKRLSEATQQGVHRVMSRLIRAGFISRERPGIFWREKNLLPTYSKFISHEEKSKTKT